MVSIIAEGVALALYCLGELGLRTDLTSLGLDSNILNLMNQNGEEIRTACSHALGGYCKGNLSKYLPKILSDINDSEKTLK